MSKPAFTNKDAEYLWDLGNELLDTEDRFAEGVRLQQIAGNLQRLDEKLLVMQSSTTSDFAKGKAVAFNEYYGRSNLPVDSRSAPVAARQFIDYSKARTVPAGKTASEVARDAKRKAERLAKQPSLGLKLNLGALRLPEVDNE